MALLQHLSWGWSLMTFKKAWSGLCFFFFLGSLQELDLTDTSLKIASTWFYVRALNIFSFFFLPSVVHGVLCTQVLSLRSVYVRWLNPLGFSMTACLSVCMKQYFLALRSKLNDILEFLENTLQLHLSWRGMEKEWECWADFNLPLLSSSRSEIHLSSAMVNRSGLGKRSQQGVKKWRETAAGGEEGGREREEGGTAGLVWGWKLIYYSADEERHARRQWALSKPLLQQHKMKQGGPSPLL